MVASLSNRQVLAERPWQALGAVGASHSRMVDLSSCYFCGAAMDVSLREYPVVPDALAPTADQQETVVLCGTCQRKLARVLDPIVDAATAGRANTTQRSTTPTAADDVDPDGVVTPAEPDRDDDRQTPSERNPPASKDASDDADDPVIPTGLVDDDSDDSDDTTPFEVDDTASVFDDGDDATDENSIFADGTTTIPDADDAPRTRDGTELGDAVTFSEDASDDADSADQKHANSKNADSTQRHTDQQRTSTNTADTTDSTDTTADGPDANDPDVDPQTYNKVVRLLKNRDLPVPRAEIEDVAGSAYAIPDHECEQIIDAAIQRGLVAEHDGDLTRPDGD